MARRIKQVVDVIFKLERHHSRGHGNTTVLFDLHKVRTGAALFLFRLNRTGHLNRTPEKQQLFGQGGFTRIRVRNDGEGTATRYLMVNRRHS